MCVGHFYYSANFVIMVDSANNSSGKALLVENLLPLP